MSKQSVAGMPIASGTWSWSYGNNVRYGYSGGNTRIAVSDQDPEIAIPLRAVYAIRKNPNNWQQIVELSLERRDRILKRADMEWGKKGWILHMFYFQFSTGAHSFVENYLRFDNKAMVACLGTLEEGYGEVDGTEGETVWRYAQGVADGAWYKNPRNWNKVRVEAKRIFSMIDVWRVDVIEYTK